MVVANCLGVGGGQCGWGCEVKPGHIRLGSARAAVMAWSVVVGIRITFSWIFPD